MKNLYLFLRIFCLLLLTFFKTGFEVIGADFRPLISNFNEKDYNGGFQNWDVAQDERGIIYFANNSGLLVYDGFSWDLYPLPGSTILRSLFYSDGKIYAGSFEQFGFFERNAIGEYVYIDLTDTLCGDVKMENEEVWRIMPWKDKIIFQTFGHIYLYDPNYNVTETVTDRIVVPGNEGVGPMSVLFCYPTKNSLYAQRSNGGFYKLSEKGWEIMWNKEETGSHIMEIVSPFEIDQEREGYPDGTIIFTQKSHIHCIKDGRPERIHTDIDRELENVQINRVVKSADGSFFIGTVGGGVFHVTPDWRLIDRFDVSRGLDNNSVLGMKEDREGNIWSGMDDGISVIFAKLPEKIISTVPSIENAGIGMVYDIGKHNGNIILATNQGVYIENTKGGFDMVEGTKGQNWFVKTIDAQTFVGGNDQTLIIEAGVGNRFEPISGTDLKRANIHGKEIVLQTTYNSLELYEKDKDGRWTYSHTIEGLNATVRQIEIAPDGTVWGSHWTKGVFRLVLSPDLSKIEKREYFTSIKGEGESGQCRVVKIRGNIYFTEGKDFYRFDDEENKFIKAENLGLLNKLEKVREISQSDDNHLWISTSEAYFLAEYDGKDYQIINTVPLDLFPRMNNGDNSRVFIDEFGVLFTLNGTIGKFQYEGDFQKTINYPLTIDYIGTVDKYGKLEKYKINEEKVPELKNDNLTVSLSYPHYGGEPVRFHFRLRSGKNVIDSIIKNPLMTFPVLGWGKHRLTCEVLDANDLVMASLDREFIVKRPWAVSWWAICCYVLGVIGVTWIVLEIIEKGKKEKLKVKYEQLQEKRDRQIKEQELLIAEQQKKLLESELSMKSKELASMALGAYGRKQAIENLQESLSDLKRKGGDVSEAERVLRDFNRNENDTRMFWDIFEKNFDLIHEHFFRNLRKHYPSLTPSDMKFCALLRMNMTTKEISKFTNLSVRGVETARYRLRKKFGLEAHESLVQFLMDFESPESIRPKVKTDISNNKNDDQTV